jgi:hypothetical protein
MVEGISRLKIFMNRVRYVVQTVIYFTLRKMKFLGMIALTGGVTYERHRKTQSVPTHQNI